MGFFMQLLPGNKNRHTLGVKEVILFPYALDIKKIGIITKVITKFGTVVMLLGHQHQFSGNKRLN